MSDLVATATGATGSGDGQGGDYTGISPVAMRREAAVMKAGADTHGDANWELGLSVRYCLNRAIRHCYLYLEGDRTEDHLGHARTRLGMAIHSEETWPHLNGNLRPVKPIEPPDDDEDGPSVTDITDATFRPLMIDAAFRTLMGDPLYPDGP